MSPRHPSVTRLVRRRGLEGGPRRLRLALEERGELRVDPREKALARPGTGPE